MLIEFFILFLCIGLLVFWYIKRWVRLHGYLKNCKPIYHPYILHKNKGFRALFDDISAYILCDDRIEYINFPFLSGKQHEQFIFDNIHFIAEQNRITIQKDCDNCTLTIPFQSENMFDTWRLFLSNKLTQNTPTHIIHNEGNNNVNIIGNVIQNK